MKTFKLLFSLAVFAIAITSCSTESDTKTTLVDFENVTLNSDSIWNGSDKSGQFTTGNSSFINKYNSDWMSWTGFASSAKTDTKTSGFTNQYSTIAGSGAAKSKKFAIAYSNASFTCKPDKSGSYSIKSMMLTNSTYTYLDMLNGSNYSKKFVANDWFKVELKGFWNKVSTGTTEYYLADYRNGKTFISKTWNKVDVSALGQVDSVAITFASSDNGEWGMNTPAYVCIDNIEFETKTVTDKK